MKLSSSCIRTYWINELKNNKVVFVVIISLKEGNTLSNHHTIAGLEMTQIYLPGKLSG